jgi:hypothetical protein
MVDCCNGFIEPDLSMTAMMLVETGLDFFFVAI